MSEMIQGTTEWHQARCGRVTASRMADVMARLKSGAYGASRATYMGQLIAERLTGVPTEGFTSAAMQHGTEYEPEARAAYAFYRGVTVTETGFVHHPDIEQSGASPDGLVGDEGLLEIKCPNTATHIETLLNGSIPKKYETQMMWQMCCTGRKWCDFASYDPRLPEEMKLFVSRLFRDDERISEMEKEAVAFLKEMDAKIADLRALYDEPEAVKMLRAG